LKPPAPPWTPGAKGWRRLDFWLVRHRPPSVSWRRSAAHRPSLAHLFCVTQEDPEPETKAARAAEKSGGGSEASFERKLATLSLVISLLAVVLSQFHPLYMFLDKPKLSGTVNPDIVVSHSWGSINLNLYLRMANTGRATGTITRVETLLEKADNTSYRKRMPVEVYVSTPATLAVGETQAQLPFGPHDISPDGRWENYVIAYEPFAKDQQNQITALIQKTQKQMSDQMRAPHPDKPVFPAEPYHIDDKLFDEISRFVHKNMAGFGLGEYNLLVLFWDDKSEKPFSVSCYSFSVFEGDVQSMESMLDQYKTGSGIVYPFSDQLPSSFQATLRPVKDERTIARMLKDFEQL
jgi:hypothetical protein